MSPRNDILADIAHGLQTPLSALKAELELIAKRGVCARSMKTCGSIITHMSLLVDDTLRLAHAEERSFENQEIFNLSERLKCIVETTNVVARSRGLTLDTRIDVGVMIVGAAREIEEMILNILSNSIKYSGASRDKTIGVSLHKLEGECVLTISDSGIGIPANDLPHIFSRLYRAPNASAYASGSGLGLAIAKRIAEAHGGYISVASVLGEGTRVTVRLPLQDVLPFEDPAPRLQQ